MKKFLKYILFVFSPILLLIAGIIIFGKPESDFKTLIDFQLTKIVDQKGSSIYFMGDSSCGNAINVKLFKRNVVNLSLTGGFISCGSLELLKFLIQQNKKIEKIYFMYTLDGFNRNKQTEYVIFERDFYVDFFLKSQNFKKNIKNFLGIKSPVIQLDDFYIKQGNKITRLETRKYIKSNISLDNEICIKEIVELCKINKINYSFLIGPNYNYLDEESLMSINDFFNQNRINFEPSYYLLNAENIGDSNDHISREYNYQSTNFYKQILNID